MRWLRRFTQRALAEKRLNSELQFHVEQRTEDYVCEGIPREQARRRALLEFGGLERFKEECRETHWENQADILARDFRFAFRGLMKDRGFAGVAILALALGIGFSTMVFSIFYNGVLFPFPYRDAERLTVIGILDTQHNSEKFRDLYHLNEVAVFRKQAESFEDIVAYGSWDVIYLHENIPELVHGCILTPNMMDFWGVPPLLGRGFTEQDVQPAAPPVVVLGYGYWKSVFHGDKSVLGTKIMLNRQARTIIGVMPRRFGLYGASVYVPINWNRPEPASYDQSREDGDPVYFFATGLVKKNVSRPTAAAGLQVIANQLAALYPKDYPEHFQMTARPLNEAIVGDFEQTLFLLIAAVVLLLLISSSNVANLLLTRHTARAREIALRSALGATRNRLIRQLFVESLLLGLAGCLGGCLLASLGLPVVRLVPGVSVPGEADMSLNLPVLFFAVILSLLTTLLFGLSPAFLAVKKDLRTNLQTTGVNVNASRQCARLRAGLVVGQVALSMLLLIFAGLMVRSFLAVTKFDPGMPTQGLVHGWIHFPARQYESVESKRAFFDCVLARLSALPGVTHTAVSFGLPPVGSPHSEDVTIPGKPHEKKWRTGIDLVNEGFFPTVGLQLLRGQLLSPNDVAGARRVAVINSTLANTYFPGENPIGRRIKFNAFDEEPQSSHDAFFEIIGVVNDLKPFEPNEPVDPQAYIPYTFFGNYDRRILVRSVTNASLLLNPFRRIIAEADPNIVVVEPSTLDDDLQAHVFMKPKFRLISFGACAALGLGLALVGLFGVMSYSVTLETHELGVRMALGAHPGNILTLVLGKGCLLVAGGIALGFLTAFLTVRALQSQLWGVSAFDPWTLVLAPLALLAAGLMACALPARRATRVDPIVALRYE
jgi:putative ABC transport system permease protein